MQNSGFIMLPRDFMSWRWYHDANTMRIFLHLVMSANYTEHDFEGITVHWGQVVTSYPSLAAKLRLSEQQVRTAFKHLKATGDISVKATSKFSVITINSFERFQSPTDKATGDKQSGNSRSTGNQQQYNKGIRKKGNNSFSGEKISEKTEALAEKPDKKEKPSDDLWAASRAIMRGNG